MLDIRRKLNLSMIVCFRGTLGENGNFFEASHFWAFVALLRLTR